MGYWPLSGAGVQLRSTSFVPTATAVRVWLTVIVAEPLTPLAVAATAKVPPKLLGALYRPLGETLPPSAGTDQVKAGWVGMAAPNWSRADAASWSVCGAAGERTAVSVPVPGVTVME